MHRAVEVTSDAVMLGVLPTSSPVTFPPPCGRLLPHGSGALPVLQTDQLVQGCTAGNGCGLAGLWLQEVGSFLQCGPDAHAGVHAHVQTHHQPSLPSHTQPHQHITSFSDGSCLLLQPSTPSSQLPGPHPRETAAGSPRQTRPSGAEGKLQGPSQAAEEVTGVGDIQEERSQRARRGQGREARQAPGRQKPQ